MKSVAGNVNIRGKRKESDLNSRWQELVLRIERGLESSSIKD